MHTSEWWLFLWRRKLIGKMPRQLSSVITIFPVMNICQNPSSHHKRFDYFTACRCILIKRYVLKPFKLRYPVQWITDVYWIFILNSMTWVLLMTITVVNWTLAQYVLYVVHTPRLWVTTWFVHPFHKCLFRAWCVCQVPFLVLGICQWTEQTRKQFLSHWT